MIQSLLDTDIGKKEFVLLTDQAHMDKVWGIMKPLVDESIREDAVKFAADDEKLLGYALSCLSYDEKDVSDVEGAEEYLEKISKAHSVPHVPHKPHKRKEYPQEWKDAAKVLGQKEWCSKYTNQPSLYQRLKKEV